MIKGKPHTVGWKFLFDTITLWTDPLCFLKTLIGIPVNIREERRAGLNRATHHLWILIRSTAACK